MLSRRSFGLGAIGTALCALTTGAASANDRKFLFVHAEGGWDPLCVFAPMFDSPDIQLEADVERLTLPSGLAIVDSPARPSVRRFFERFGDQTVLFNGVSTRSVNHEVCQVVAMTGSTSDDVSDWATLLAVSDQERYYLPHLVLNGPAFPGAHTVAVSRAEGRVQDAVRGTLLEQCDQPLVVPSALAAGRIDDYLAGRAAGLVALRPELALAQSYQAALGRARALTDAKELIQFDQAADLPGLAQNALRLLADGVTRCATISTGFVWDTHTTNAEQTPQFELLFSSLEAIVDAMGEDTIMVVLSEMGRTPAYNGTGGRDHWPYTSALLIGAGLAGGRSFGGFDDGYNGIGVDPASGALDRARPGVDPKQIGATLLALGGIDPAEHILGAEIIAGVEA